MKERPILFSAPMVRPVLADRKFVTRRLSPQWAKVKAGDRLWVRETWAPWTNNERVESAAYVADYPDSLPPWHPTNEFRRWKPSIHMPRWASRILLECEENTRAERLQDITEEEAEAEGCEGLENGLECNFCGQWRGYEDSRGVQRVDTPDGEDWYFVCPRCGETLAYYPMDEQCQQHFRDVWATLHTKPGERWEDNPTVYRVGRFHRVGQL